MEKKSLKKRLMALGLIAISFVAVAKTIGINAGSGVFRNVAAAQGVGIGDGVELRIAALRGLVGMYQTAYGVTSVSIGDVVAVTYTDGSKEQAQVACFAGTVCVVPLPNTQVAPGSGAGTGIGGGGGNGGGTGGGTGGGGGWTPPPANGCPKCTVTVG
ncbi:hypothetical protein NJ284_07980 [Xanthomonas citri pv. anacardii]|nr:hypothetical protein [Xanthomonas citri]